MIPTTLHSANPRPREPTGNVFGWHCRVFRACGWQRRGGTAELWQNGKLTENWWVFPSARGVALEVALGARAALCPMAEPHKVGEQPVELIASGAGRGRSCPVHPELFRVFLPDEPYRDCAYSDKIGTYCILFVARYLFADLLSRVGRDGQTETSRSRGANVVVVLHVSVRSELVLHVLTAKQKESDGIAAVKTVTFLFRELFRRIAVTLRVMVWKLRHWHRSSRSMVWPKSGAPGIWMKLGAQYDRV